MRRFSILTLVLTATLLPDVFAVFSWKQVSVKGSYVPRSEAAFTSCGNGNLCLLGGRGTNPVSILDTQSLSWSTKEDFPPLEIHHFQAFEGPDKCAWVVGAWTGSFPDEKTVDEILIYCPDDGKWSVGHAIERPRGAGGSFLYDGGVFLVSGNVGGHNADAKLVDWFDRLDLETGEWSQLPPIPHPRDHFHAVVLNDKLYVAGGRDSTGNEPEFFDDVEEKVDVFDFKSQQWSTIDDFPRPRGGTFSTAFDDTVFVLGGEGNNRAWTEVDVLDGTIFMQGDEMPTPRHGTGAVSCNGVIWVAGGVTVQGGGNEATDTIAYFDGEDVPRCRAPESDSPPTSPATPTRDPAESEPAASQTPSNPPGTENADVAPSGQAPAPTAGVESSSIPTQSSDTNVPSGDENTVEDDDTDNEDEENQDRPQDSPMEESSGPACFPSDAIVELRDGRTITMEDLRIGDEVKVSLSGAYSPIFFFSHRHGDRIDQFVRIETAASNLTVSPGHLVYANGRAVRASNLRLGDKVHVIRRGRQGTISDTVTLVKRITSRGLHNPHTLHGDIVVNDVVVTTFTSAVHPAVAHLLLFPFRVSYMILGPHNILDRMNARVLEALTPWFWGK